MKWRNNTEITIIGRAVPVPVAKAARGAVAPSRAGKKQQNGDISVVVKDQQDVAGKIIL